MVGIVPIATTADSAISLSDGKPGLVSAIVTTRNSATTLATCLQSVREQRFRDVELLVVDNSSEDATPEIARRYADRVVSIGPERSAQRNRGAGLSAGEFLMFLDADMELTPGVIDNCVSGIGDMDALVIPETTTGSSWLARVRSVERRSYVGFLLFEAARFIRRNVFFELAGYDVGLTGLEDYDLEARLEEGGYKVGHSQVPILHHEDDVTLSRYLRKRRYYAIGYGRYAERHPERARAQFGPGRGLFYARRLCGSPWALTEVLCLKGLEFAAANIAPKAHPTETRDVY